MDTHNVLTTSVNSIFPSEGTSMIYLITSFLFLLLTLTYGRNIRLVSDLKLLDIWHHYDGDKKHVGIWHYEQIAESNIYIYIYAALGEMS